MSARILRILIYGTLGFLILVIGTGIYQRHFGNEVKTYVEVQHSLYNISNQCIADYYADELSNDGTVISFYSKLKECEARFISKSIVKIFDSDTKQQHKVKAYQLHGVMLKMDANGCFMDRVVLRRLDNDDFVQDITERMREKHPEDNVINSSFDTDLEV